MRVRVALTGVLAALALTTSARAADDVPFVDWTTLLPSVSNEYAPSQEKDCVNGEDACIDATIAEMYRRFNTVIPRCDHRAVFSITYLRVTEAIRNALRSDFYIEPTFLQHEDKVFARMYFTGWDNFEAGKRELVPPAWRVAYDAAKARDVSGLGDLLLSMNAHINRDMPFMLAALGLTMPDGRTRKIDHDRGNALLAKLYGPVITEIAQRFDPKADDVNAGSGDEALAIGILQTWREGVWRNAERLVLAPNQQARQMVANEIEQDAKTFGDAIRQGTKVDAAGAKARDTWCATHGGQDPAAGSKPSPPPGKQPTSGGSARMPRAATFALGADRTIGVRMACPAGGPPCKGRLQLTRRGAPKKRAKATTAAKRKRTKARKAFTLAPGASGIVKIPLDPKAAKDLREAGSGWFTLTVSRKGVAGKRAKARRAVRVRA
jgi:Family of unknown function (DUF5995)